MSSWFCSPAVMPACNSWNSDKAVPLHIGALCQIARRTWALGRASRFADARVPASGWPAVRRLTAAAPATGGRRHPYGYTHAPDADDWPGLFRLGDQATVIASLTGDGVALAVASAAQASRTWLAQGNATASYHHDWARSVARQMSLASLVHRACLAPAVQPWVVRACRVWPMALRLVASHTRIASAPPR